MSVRRIDKSAIIFCRVIDYFGDAGFCWRLSLALLGQGFGQVVLVTDQLAVVKQLQGADAPNRVEVLDWDRAVADWGKGGVSRRYRSALVLEAFGCAAPDALVRNLLPQAQWITLDHLATESWADHVHAAQSPHPIVRSAAARRWFVPGFSAKTGGLVHGHWRHISLNERDAWRSKLVGYPIGRDTFLVLAFGYGDAQWPQLEEAMAQILPKGFKKAEVWKPRGLDYSQEEFDEILQACDLNFVRGEDSFVRAHWAAAGPWQVPFVWQPYRQAANAHAEKLAGWVEQMLNEAHFQPLRDFHWAWNRLPPSGGATALDFDRAWALFCRSYTRIRLGLSKNCGSLALEPSLEARLRALMG